MRHCTGINHRLPCLLCATAHRCGVLYVILLQECLRRVRTLAMIASASSFLKKKNPSWVLFCKTRTYRADHSMHWVVYRHIASMLCSSSRFMTCVAQASLTHWESLCMHACMQAESSRRLQMCWQCACCCSPLQQPERTRSWGWQLCKLGWVPGAPSHLPWPCSTQTAAALSDCDLCCCFDCCSHCWCCPGRERCLDCCCCWRCCVRA